MSDPADTQRHPAFTRPPTGEHLLEQPYGPEHPLYLGTDDDPARPAGAAVMLAAGDVLRMVDAGHTLGAATIDARVIARLAESGGTRDDLGVLLDAGALRSARTALQTWRTREGATGSIPVVTPTVTSVTETVTEQQEEPDDDAP